MQTNTLGSLIATAYRDGLTSLMDDKETSHYAIHIQPTANHDAVIL
jgi:hypothetical protein